MALSALAGAIAGWGDVAYSVLRRLLRHEFVFRSPDYVWLPPLVNAVFFVAIGIIALLLARSLKRGLSRSALLFVLAFLTAISGLLLIEPLHRGAALLLSLGIGALLARNATRIGPPIERLAPRAAGLLLLIAVAIGVGRTAIDRGRDREAVSRLPAPRAGLPNILLIILDTARAANLSLYGYHRPTTPFLAELAGRGVRFDRAIATAPWTLPSHGSLFTGRDAQDLPTNWFTPLDGRFPTLAEELDQLGYETGGFTGNLPYTSRETGLARGFSHYEDYPASLGQFASHVVIVRQIASTAAFKRMVGSYDRLGFKRGDDVSRSFLRWLDRPRTRPTFAFLNYYDAHMPYWAPAGYRAQFATPAVPLVPELERRSTDQERWDPKVVQGAVDAYDAELKYVDDQLRELFDALGKRGRLDSTVVVITADHGEEFNEHGFIDHGISVYLPVVWVPLLVVYPARVPSGAVVAQPVSTKNIGATILDLIGGSGARFGGQSLSGSWTGDPAAVSLTEAIRTQVRRVPRLPAIYPAGQADVTAVLSGGWRLIATDGRVELFDLSTDPGELHDRAQDPAVRDTLERLRSLLEVKTAGSR